MDNAADDDTGTALTRWRVAPASGFRVRHRDGSVPLTQIDAEDFEVEVAFEFHDSEVIADLVSKLEADGKTPAEARELVDDARTYTTAYGPTDLASIPRIVRWFENTYGPHTLAAIIHDRLIQKQPNTGTLRSDALADRFFRQMLASSGVPWLKRWIMWAAVALRSRFEAGGHRRVAIIVWAVFALAGIGTFYRVLADALPGVDAPGDSVALVAGAAVLPIVSAPLWGRQWGASLVAGAAALWVLPAAVFAAIGFGFYRLLEFATGKLGLE